MQVDLFMRVNADVFEKVGTYRHVADKTATRSKWSFRGCGCQKSLTIISKTFQVLLKILSGDRGYDETFVVGSNPLKEEIRELGIIQGLPYHWMRTGCSGILEQGMAFLETVTTVHP